MNTQGEVAAVNAGEEAKRRTTVAFLVYTTCFIFKQRPKERGKCISLYSKMWLSLVSGWVRT